MKLVMGPAKFIFVPWVFVLMLTPRHSLSPPLSFLLKSIVIYQIQFGNRPVFFYPIALSLSNLLI